MINAIQNYVTKQISSLSNHLETGISKAKLAQLRRGIGKWAIYIALTMYALHQQGHSEPVNKQGYEYFLGQAVGKLVKNTDDLERVQRRFSVMALSSDMTELSYNLR